MPLYTKFQRRQPAERVDPATLVAVLRAAMGQHNLPNGVDRIVLSYTLPPLFHMFSRVLVHASIVDNECLTCDWIQTETLAAPARNPPLSWRSRTSTRFSYLIPADTDLMELFAPKCPRQPILGCSCSYLVRKGDMESTHDVLLPDISLARTVETKWELYDDEVFALSWDNGQCTGLAIEEHKTLPYSEEEEEESRGPPKFKHTHDSEEQADYSGRKQVDEMLRLETMLCGAYTVLQRWASRQSSVDEKRLPKAPTYLGNIVVHNRWRWWYGGSIAVCVHCLFLPSTHETSWDAFVREEQFWASCNRTEENEILECDHIALCELDDSAVSGGRPVNILSTSGAGGNGKLPRKRKHKKGHTRRVKATWKKKRGNDFNSSPGDRSKQKRPRAVPRSRRRARGGHDNKRERRERAQMSRRWVKRLGGAWHDQA